MINDYNQTYKSLLTHTLRGYVCVERQREIGAENEIKRAENILLGSSQMLQVSIETPNTSHSSLFSLYFFIYFVVSSSRIT